MITTGQSNGSATAGFWLDRNVLVTGCTGLLGSWLTGQLVELGANVAGLVRDSIPRRRLASTGLLDKVSIVHGALEDFPLVERALNEYEVDTVFHLGAQTIVGIANRNPLSTFESNIKGTWVMMEACRRAPTVKQIIVASSDKAYGDHETLPYDESFPLQGSHPYDVSKSCADLIAQCYHTSYGSPVVITRCGNLYGGGDLNFNRVIPGTIRSIIRGERPAIRSDGTLTRDYIYVEEGVRACLLLAEKLAAEPELAGQAFNFSCEQPLSVLAITNAVLQAMGREDLQPVILNHATNEILHQYLRAERAHRLLGWQPIFSLEEGLQRTVDWYRELFASEAGADLPAKAAPVPYGDL